MPKKILVAEPNDYLSESLVGLFNTRMYEVVRTSNDNTEIIKLLQEFKPDLLLIDFDMSQQIDIGAVKAQFPKLKVVGSLRHEAFDGFTEIAKKFGLDGFLSKYESQEHVLELIKKLLT